jgi:hypothetical protein
MRTELGEVKHRSIIYNIPLLNDYTNQVRTMTIFTSTILYLAVYFHTWRLFITIENLSYSNPPGDDVGFALLPFICSFNTLHYLIIISDIAVLILTYVVSQTSCVLSLTNFLFSLCYMFRFRKAVKAMFVLIPLFIERIIVT